jgi:hypothetical protein
MSLLQSPAWNETTRTSLETLIQKGAGRAQVAVFDFDNTLVCGDIGEATLAVLTRDRIIEKDSVPAVLSPDFIGAEGKKISLPDCVDLTVYYESLLASSTHQKDPNPLSSGYVWAVEIMQGLSVQDVISATAEAFRDSEPLREKQIIVTEGKTSYLIPFFYPEMIELLNALIDHDFDVWIVSATNVWTVRWMVKNRLNPLLSKKGIAPEKVIGVSTLLQDGQNYLYKDHLLVHTDPDYAALDEKTISALKLTAKINFPVSTYTGKVACILDFIGKRPFLAAGDSPGDHPILRYSEHKLWIARIEKPDNQTLTRRLIDIDGIPENWLFQSVRTKKTPGFFS